MVVFTLTRARRSLYRKLDTYNFKNLPVDRRFFPYHTVSIRLSVRELGKLESKFGTETGPRIKMFYTRSTRLVLNSTKLVLN